MKKVISIILCLAWMGFIFYNSSQNGLESNARSEEFLKSIKKYYIEMKNTVKKPKSVESFKAYKEDKKADSSRDKNNNIINKNNDTQVPKDNNNVSSKNNNSNSNTVKKSNSTANDKKLKFENYLVRRGAHALEYIVLAILIANAFWQFGIRNKNVIIYVLFIALFYAVLDEFHQSFVKGRTSEVGDVLLDFSGAIFGTITWCFWQKIKGTFKRRFSKTQNNGI
ncbi:VanZ family protein [Clostridium pascui]|uniref:VanZ family protein n=1 Tax=Clostridium pascui TaxID=46609 RepID=UPI00195CED90|nr:VanZ family protein [Clostridium pascui]MBM7869870.1 VanZ family protein [Clostridium pascui]